MRYSETLPLSGALPCTAIATGRAGLDSVLDVCASATWLIDLAPGTCGLVGAVQIAGALGDRLVELGFTPGSRVRVLRRAPFGGPLLVQIRSFVLSIRLDQARAIAIASAEKQEPEQH